MDTYKKNKTDMSKMIGSRMKDARINAKFSQERAAKRLGFKNSSQLSKLENAIDSRVPSIHRIIEISRLYGVTTDYLLGVSSNFDKDDRDAQKYALRDGVVDQACDVFEAESRAVRVALKKTQSQIDCLSTVITKALDDARKSKEAMLRFAELNKSFCDMRGGATLVRRINESEDNALNAVAMIKRFKMKNTMTQRLEQRDIFEIEDEYA